ncbi:MAG: DUF58 domain-containing protein [Clostridia bacterium]|nr:DUF58 domain-containing protein [Clostridia bacterium]MCL6522387.1 DUF58 domain-containing protein [Bacillota bacterium]
MRHLRLSDPWLPALWAALGLAALLMGGQLPWSVFYLFTGLLLLSGGWTLYAARHVRVAFVRGRLRTTAGGRLEVGLAVENDGWLPVPRLRLEDAPGARVGLLPAPLLLSLPVSASATYRLRTAPLRRGRYRLGPLEAAVRDPFGLFEHRWRVEGEETLTVYPRVLPLERLSLPLGEPYGQAETRRRNLADPTSLAGARPAQPGDAARWIHWKASARRGMLFTKQFDPTAGGQAVLVLDGRLRAYLESAGRVGGREEAPADLFDTACELVAACARAWLGRNMAVGAWIPGQGGTWIAPRAGDAQMALLLEALAAAQPGEEEMAAALGELALELPARTALVVVSPRFDQPLAAALERLQRAGFGLLALLALPRRGTGRDGSLPFAPHRAAAGEPGPDRLLGDLARAGIPAYAVASVGELAALLGGEGAGRSRSL